MPPLISRRGWALSLLLGAAPAAAQAPERGAPVRPAAEAIGSWVLQCPPAAGESCTLRHRDPVLPPSDGGPAVGLEVRARGGALVPMITLRDLRPDAADGGSVAVEPLVSLGFDGGQPEVLTCGPAAGIVVCAPGAASAPDLAAALPRARSASVQVSIGAAPPRGRVLDLTGTHQALAGLRAANKALPAHPGLDLTGFLDQLLHDLGYPQGLAGVLPGVLALFGLPRS